MEYEELSYRRMLQVIESSRICHVAVVHGRIPYVVPMCCSCRMDGCIPVFELHAKHEGDLLEALAAGSSVTLLFERSLRGGATETVLVYGRAAVEQTMPQEYADQSSARRSEADIWAQIGQVRFGAYGEQHAEGCRCTEGCPGCSCRNEAARRGTDGCREKAAPCPCHSHGAPEACRTGDACPLHPRTQGCTDCADRYDRCRPAPQPHCPAHITVTADEMTGRCYSACAVRCRNDAEWAD